MTDHIPDIRKKVQPGALGSNEGLGPLVAWTDEQAYHFGRGAYECSVLPAGSGRDVKAFWQLTSIQQAGWVAKAARAAERERCAAWVDARRDAFIEEYGSTDPDTGALEFGRGAHADAKTEYVGELTEIAEGLRALPGA